MATKIKKLISKNPSPIFKYLSISLILLFGLLIRIIFATSFIGYPADISCFKGWSLSAFENFRNFYTNGQFADYPPLYVYVMFVLGAIAKLFKLSYESTSFTLLIKMPAIICDLITGFLLFKLAIKNVKSSYAYGIAVFFILNPAIILNSTMWGQVDSVFTLLLVIALYYISVDKMIFSSLFFTLSILMKPQGIIFLPVLFFELLRRKSLQTILISAATSISTLILLILPFSFNQKPLWLIDLYKNTANNYKYASLNAYNFYSLLGNNARNDQDIFCVFNYNTWGLIFITLITLYIGFLYLKNKTQNIHYLTSLLLITGTFVMSSRMHERYLYPAIALALLSLIVTKNLNILLMNVIFTITIFINTWEVLRRALNNEYPWLDGHDSVLLTFSFVNVALLVWLIIISYNIIARNKGFIVKSMLQITQKNKLR